MTGVAGVLDVDLRLPPGTSRVQALGLGDQGAVARAAVLVLTPGQRATLPGKWGLTAQRPGVIPQ